MKELAVDEWTLGKLARLSAKDFWTWTKTDTTGYDGHNFLTMNKCVDFKKESCFKLGKRM